MRTKLGSLGQYVGHLAMGAAMFAALPFFGVAIHLLATGLKPCWMTERSFS